jgi:hypothetical protein
MISMSHFVRIIINCYDCNCFLLYKEEWHTVCDLVAGWLNNYHHNNTHSD